MGAGLGIRAVLCDLDGTLIDSLPALRDAYRQFLAERAPGATSPPPFERWTGTALRDVVRELALELELQHGPEELLAHYLAVLERSYVLHAASAPGALALLDELRARGIRTAVVTSAPRDLALRVLDRCDLLRRIDAVVAGDDVDDAKPAPLGYLEALRRLEVPAEQAIALEDSRAGVQAAVAAGVRCIALDGTGADSAWIQTSGAQASRDLAGALELLRSA
jgi:HAD superfamily hydrolase (TIGR01509 family)